MKATIYCRVSTDNQEQEGTSLQTQLEACLHYCEGKSYEVTNQFSEAYSGLSLSRPKLDRLRELVRDKAIDVVVIYCLDRLSRDPTHGVILTQELEKHHVTLEAVTEDVDSSELGKLIAYVKGYASKLEAEKIRERTMRGKVALAKQGKISSGYGRYGGYLGLLYDQKTKAFVPVPGQIDIAGEILRRALAGESSSHITRELQSRAVHSVAGRPIHRSIVSRVLTHAKVYAGVLTWNGIEIRGKVEAPIITVEQAERIASRLRLNKKNSLSFGKRKWLTGRVFCQICGRRYSLDSNKGCYCNGADKRSPNPCPSPKIGLKELNSLAFNALYSALTDREAIMDKIRRTHADWEREQSFRNDLKLEWDRHRQKKDERRRKLAFEHEIGGITDAEYVSRLSQIQKEADDAPSLDLFLDTPEPMTVEEALELVGDGRFDTMVELHRLGDYTNTENKEMSELAERIGLKVIIGLPKTKDSRWSTQILMNLTPSPSSKMVLTTLS